MTARYDPMRLIALEEQRHRVMAECAALVDLRAEAQERVTGVLRAASLATRDGSFRQVADVAAENAHRAKNKNPPAVNPEDVRAAEEAEAYITDLAPRIRAAEGRASAMARLVDACRKHAGVTR